MPEPPHSRFDYLPVLVLAGIVAAVAIGYWLFPHLQRIIQREDCIAVGHNDC